MKIFKHLLFFSVLLIGFKPAHAQYANAWINYNQQYYKIKVVADGMYRIDYNALQSAGIPVSTINGNTFQLFSRGASVPVYTTSTNPFSSSDYLEFYGLKNDGSTESTLYNAPADQTNDKLSLFNDTAAYFLTWSTNPNPDIIVDYNNVINSPPPQENYCLYTSTNIYGGARGTSNYIHGKPEIQGQAIWDSDFSPAEGYIDIAYNHTSVNKNVYTPYAYTSGPDAELKTQWVGKFPTDHYMQLSVGGTLFITRSYFGFNVQRFDTIFTNALLGSPNTVVNYNTSNNPTTATDFNGVSYIQITYPRQFNFDNTSTFPFTLPSAAGERYLVVTGFNSQSTLPILYDLTNKLRLIGVTGGLDTIKYLLPASSGNRNLVMVANNTTAITPISTLQQRTFT